MFDFTSKMIYMLGDLGPPAHFLPPTPSLCLLHLHSDVVMSSEEVLKGYYLTYNTNLYNM